MNLPNLRPETLRLCLESNGIGQLLVLLAEELLVHGETRPHNDEAKSLGNTPVAQHPSLPKEASKLLAQLDSNLAHLLDRVTPPSAEGSTSAPHPGTKEMAKRVGFPSSVLHVLPFLSNYDSIKEVCIVEDLGYLVTHPKASVFG
jgi:hypothetical protein